MAMDPTHTEEHDEDSVEGADFGSLSVEDDAEGTVDPAELAGTANADDDEVGYQPEFSEADEGGV